MTDSIIKIAARHVREGSGSYAGDLRRRTRKQKLPDLKTLFGAVPYLLVGGLACRLYMPERVTMDVDVLVPAERAGDVEAQLRARAAVCRGPLSIGGASWQLAGGESLDVLVSAEEWASEAFQHPVMDQGVPCMSLSYLVLMKFKAGRVQDMADISRMLGPLDEQDLEPVRTVVLKYLPQDIQDIESLARLGRLEFEAEGE